MNSDNDDFNPRKHFEDFADQSQLSPRARHHLSSMYGHLAVTALMALVACWMQINGTLRGGGVLPAIGGIGVLWSLSRISSPVLRQLTLYLFGFLEGMGLAPIVDNMYYLQPSVLISALMTTFLIFAGFTMTALMSPRRSYLYLSGLISAGMVILFSGSVFGLFFQTELIDNAVLFIGLLLFSLLVTLDTQVVVERVEAGRGSSDPIIDAANMLINIVGILRRVLMIMAQRETRSKDQKRRQKRN